MKVAMSESPEVCQFPPTEAISPHWYNASASNWKQRLKFGIFACTNFVKLNVYLRRLSQDYMHFSACFIPRLFEVITIDCVLLVTMTSNVPHTQLFSPYRTSCPKGQCEDFRLQLCMIRLLHASCGMYRYAELLLFTCRFVRTDQA